MLHAHAHLVPQVYSYPACIAGDSCVAPDRCSCRSGWTAKAVRIAQHSMHALDVSAQLASDTTNGRCRDTLLFLYNGLQIAVKQNAIMSCTILQSSSSMSYSAPWHLIEGDSTPNSLLHKIYV